MEKTIRPATRTRRAIVLGLSGLLISATSLHLDAAQAAPARVSLSGLFRLQKGTWSGGAHGSYFRMLQPDGKTYLTNTSSPAGDKSFTLLSAGTDGGLRTRTYQATPKPAFAKNGDALSGKVTAPTDFFGIKFATATNQKDPQTGQSTALPTIYATGSKLSGNLSAFAASWNNQHFNQGSPKPNGSSPGFTRAVSGTYNAKTRAYTLTWRSLIVGGPFNKFTGEWHLTGTFTPAKAKAAPASSAPAAPKAPVRSSTSKAPTSAAPKSSASSSAAKTSTAKTSAARSRAATTAAAKRSASPAQSSSATSAAAASAAAAPATADPALALAGKTSKQVAAGKDDNGTSPWLIGGGVAVVAALGLLAFWFVRIRPANS